MPMHQFISSLNILYKQLKDEKKQQEDQAAEQQSSFDTSSISREISSLASALRH